MTTLIEQLDLGEHIELQEMTPDQKIEVKVALMGAADYFNEFEGGVNLSDAAVTQLFANHLLGIYANGAIIGLVSLAEPIASTWYIDTFFVIEQWREQKVATKVITALKNVGHDRAIEQLELQVIQSNVTAHMFLFKQGFKMQRVVPEWQNQAGEIYPLDIMAFTIE
ncbi:GNAT family N-acetyltransferase [Weissella soli]|uniref:GNAT family N-acetyltransferase n=1 Tax=Weissella soli TaxID=155866 RepID=UPI0035A1A7E3